MTTLQFEGSVVSPAPSGCFNPCGPSGLGAEFTFALVPFVGEFAEVRFGTRVLVSAEWLQLLGLAASAFDSLEFLAVSITEGNLGDISLLLGGPPVITGASGVFPTAAGGQLSVAVLSIDADGAETVRYETGAITIDVGDTLAEVVGKINSALVLDGAPAVVATAVGGQIVLRSDIPGAAQAIAVNVDAAIGSGLPDAATVTGTGTALSVNRVFVVSLTAAQLAGEDVWVRVPAGTATINFAAAGN
jgi:hypothetical protein